MNITAILAEEFDVRPDVAARIVALLDEGNTVPFIARYRKEQTGAMDDQKLRALSERLEYLRALDKRREQIERAIEEQGKLTPEIAGQLAGAQTLSALEDIYRPYKPRRRTRAMIAREKGMEPLARAIRAQGTTPQLRKISAWNRAGKCGQPSAGRGLVSGNVGMENSSLIKALGG